RPRRHLRLALTAALEAQRSAETTAQRKEISRNNGGASGPRCTHSGLGAPPLFRRGCLVRSVAGRLVDSRLPAFGIRGLLPAQMSRGGHGPACGEQAGTAAEERQGAVRSGPRQLTAVGAAGSTAAAGSIASARARIAASARRCARGCSLLRPVLGTGRRAGCIGVGFLPARFRVRARPGAIGRIVVVGTVAVGAVSVGV